MRINNIVVIKKMKNTKSKPLVVIQCYEDRQPTLPLRKAEDASNQPQTKRDSADLPPPPPPPMPATNGQTNGDHKRIEISKPVQKAINTDLKKTNARNSALTRTPTPDYNSKIDLAHVKLKNGKDEKAELESLESYKLKTPSSVLPKPPSNYFVRAPNGTATMKKHVRPVSVTIGEYASSTGTGFNRREPSKLEFLNGEKPDGPLNDDSSITNRLQSELAMTLSRSNLRKKTESLADAGR